jgi:hypothetical protein
MVKKLSLLVTVWTFFFFMSTGFAGEMERWGSQPMSNFTTDPATIDRFRSYMADPNWGKAYELSNSASQAYAAKQNIKTVQAELNSAKSYVKESLPILSRQVSWATQTELGVRKIMLGHEIAQEALGVLGNPPMIEMASRKIVDSGKLGDIVHRFKIDDMIGSGIVNAYGEKLIQDMWRPIDQGIAGVETLTNYHMPTLQTDIKRSTEQYRAARSDVIKNTLDAVETIRAGGDPNRVLRSTLQGTGIQLSDDLLRQSSKSHTDQPVQIQFTNPSTNRTENAFVSQQTANALNQWGQKQVEAQKRLGELATPKMNTNNTYTPPTMNSYSTPSFNVPTYTPRFNSSPSSNFSMPKSSFSMPSSSFGGFGRRR